MDVGKDLQRAFDDGYNKALDDFTDVAYRRLGSSNQDLYCVDVIDEIVKQLREQMKF